ncbi:hypothetical protein MTO96_005689 [Rhipicephalus appendiculatus]
MSRCNSSTTVEIVEGGSCPSRSRSPSPSVCIVSTTEPRRPPSPTVCIVTESSRPPVAQRGSGEGRGAVAQLLRREQQAHLVAHHRLRGERGRAAAAAEGRPFAQRVHRHVVVAAAPAVARRVHRDGGQAAVTWRVHCHRDTQVSVSSGGGH